MSNVQMWYDAFPIFEGLKPEVMEYLITQSEERSVPSGEIVFPEGDLGNDLFLMLNGSVEIIRGLGTEKEKKLAVLNGPDFFGEMSILECQPRSATVRALEDSTLHIIYSTDLYDLFQKWPDQYAVLLHRLARHMARRLRAEGMEFHG